MTESDRVADTEPSGPRGIAWFDPDESAELFASGVMAPPPLSAEAVGVARTSRIHEGIASRVLFQDPDHSGFSLVHAWVGEDYPLPRHTHSGDCLYYVLRGELRMGSKTVSAGSGFLVRSGRPYTYRAGSGGAEVLEFRSVSSFDMVALDQDVERWRAFSEIAEAMGPAWSETKPAWARRLAGEPE